MEWKDFLTHPEVIEYSGHELPGKYLFLKTLYEIVAGLNGYRGWVITMVKYSTGNSILDNDQDWFSQWDVVAKAWPPSSLKDIPADVQDWVSRWNPFVEEWLSSLRVIQQRYAIETVDDTEWPTLIDMLTTIPAEVSRQYFEVQALTLPDDKLTKDFVMGLTACVEGVVSICNYIREKEYIKLWKYPDRES
jgi:hypothetical protein